MDSKVLLAILDSLVDDAVSKIKVDIPEPISGPRGLRGKDGSDFNIEDHKETIQAFVLQNIPKLKLTEEEIESLKGPRGQRGKQGDGFTLEEAKALVAKAVEDVSPNLKLKFSDLSEEEIDSIKLKFSSLSDEEIESLRGPMGLRGKDGREGVDGKDLVLEDAKEFLLESIADSVMALAPDLKLKFSDLSEEEVSSVVGPRGQRGKQGSQGIQGDTGPEGKSIRGLPGQAGLDGRDGISIKGEDGRDGKDAPEVVDVSIDQDDRDLTFNFDFSDGSRLRTNAVELPKPKGVTNIYSSGGGGSSIAAKGDVRNILLGTKEVSGMPVASILFDADSILYHDDNGVS